MATPIVPISAPPVLRTEAPEFHSFPTMGLENQPDDAYAGAGSSLFSSSIFFDPNAPLSFIISALDLAYGSTTISLP